MSCYAAFISPLLFSYDYIHKKQTGGAGQFGRVIGRLEPLSGDELTAVQFVDETIGRCLVEYTGKYELNSSTKNDIEQNCFSTFFVQV